jgi:hypothetical protein
MPSLINEALDWLDRAEDAWVAAEQLTDLKVKNARVQAARTYERLAQVAADRAKEQKKHELALATQADLPS